MKATKDLEKLETALRSKQIKASQKTVKRDKRFGIVYTRVSSLEQEENNSSLETQLKLCNDYAQRENIIIKKYFGGSYESAKSDERKEFKKALVYAKKDKDIAFIIVYSFDRFSRTGAAAAQLSADLAKSGIWIKSITQDIDSSTPTGKFQEDMFHLFNHYDNQQRANRTITNTREIMLKGYWPYSTPLGYKNLKPKHRACDHKYIITEAGDGLKKAFQLKAEGILTNQEIIKKVRCTGINLNEKNFRAVISNPFYAGFVTGRFLKGKLVKGLHPALIDVKTFIKANGLLASAPTVGIAKTNRVEELPLKIFAKDEISNCQFTGYIKKGNWYYKTRNKTGKVNISAIKLNEHFKQLLQQFEYNPKCKNLLRKKLEEKIKQKLNHQIKDDVQLKKKISETQTQLEDMEERYVLGNLKKELFDKYEEKYKKEIVGLQQELANSSFKSSNLETVIEKGLSIAENISQLWLSSDFSNKQRLQYLVFPEGIVYNKEKDRVRTDKINSLFSEIPLLARVTPDNKKSNSKKNCFESSSVPGKGIEPSHPCERQILSE